LFNLIIVIERGAGGMLGRLGIGKGQTNVVHATKYETDGKKKNIERF
jgi:hypothetical protein